jgi:hypothetical protein
METYLVLGTIILDIASLVQGACDGQATAKCTAAPSSDIDVPPGVHLFQSSVGRSVMRSDSALGLQLDDLEDSLLRTPVKPVASSDDRAFYLGVCVDILVCLIIVPILVEGSRRFRRPFSKSKPSLASSKTQKEVPSTEGSSADLQGSALVLHAAACNGDAEKCEYLLQNAKDGVKRLLRESDKWGRTVLHLAVLRGSEPVAALLLKFGAKVDTSDAWDHAPLHCAAYSGSVECCTLLIQYGAEVNVVDAGERTPLHVAADLGHEAVCRLLLEHGGTLSQENTAEVPALLSALLVERMFEKVPANAESVSKDGATESVDEWQSDFAEDDALFYPEEQQ